MTWLGWESSEATEDSRRLASKAEGRGSRGICGLCPPITRNAG